MKVTPLHITLMIHYHAISAPVKNASAPAVIKYTKDLIEHGLIVPCTLSDSKFKSTSKGAFWIKMLQATPLPMMVFVDPRDQMS